MQNRNDEGLMITPERARPGRSMKEATPNQMQSSLKNKFEQISCKKNELDAFPVSTVERKPIIPAVNIRLTRRTFLDENANGINSDRKQRGDSGQRNQLSSERRAKKGKRKSSQVRSDGELTIQEEERGILHKELKLMYLQIRKLRSSIEMGSISDGHAGLQTLLGEFARKFEKRKAMVIENMGEITSMATLVLTNIAMMAKHLRKEDDTKEVAKKILLIDETNTFARTIRNPGSGKHADLRGDLPESGTLDTIIFQSLQKLEAILDAELKERAELRAIIDAQLGRTFRPNVDPVPSAPATQPSDVKGKGFLKKYGSYFLFPAFMVALYLGKKLPGGGPSKDMPPIDMKSHPTFGLTSSSLIFGALCAGLGSVFI